MDKEITFRFVRSANYHIVVANGAWGGMTPRGELKFDLFFEHVELPEAISYLSTPDGLGPEVSRTPAVTPITREALIAVVMTTENAENLGRWLLEKVGQQRKKEAGEPETKGS